MIGIASRSRHKSGNEIEAITAEQLPDVRDDAARAPGRAVEFEARRTHSDRELRRLLARRVYGANDVPRLRPRDMTEQPCSGCFGRKIGARSGGNLVERDEAALERKGLVRRHMNTRNAERRPGAKLVPRGFVGR